MRTPALAPFLLAALAAPAAAFELVVGPPGSGAAFTSIQAAIDAAAPGERVLVLPGTYEETLSVVGPVDVIGADTTAVTLRTPPGSGAPAVRVSGIAAGTFTRVSGMRIETGVGAAPLALVEVEDCVGAVELHDLRASDVVVPPVAPGVDAALLSVEDSGLVVVSQCTFQASALPSLVAGGAVLDGVAGARLVASRVWITHTTLAAGWGSTPTAGTGAGGVGGDAVVAIGSRVEVGASTLLGGESGGTAPVLAGVGGAGLRAVASQVMIAGGSGGVVQGAPAVWGMPIGSVARYASAAEGAVLDAASVLEHATDALPAGGAAAGSFPPAADVAASPGATVLAFPERLPILGYDAAIAKIGGISRRIYEGEPGSIHWVFASIMGTAPVIDLPGLGAIVCWIPPISEGAPVVLDAGGGVTLHLPVPNDANLAWLCFVVQSVQFTPVTGLRISPPTILRVSP